MGLYGVGIDERIDQAHPGLQSLWRSVAAVFLILLLVAAGVTMERAERRKKEFQRFGPTRFGDLGQETYAITETSGQYIRPQAVAVSNEWVEITKPEMKLSLRIPSHWEERGSSKTTLSYAVPSRIFGSKTFSIQLLRNSRRYDPRELVWREVLGFDNALDVGISEGVVELLTPFLLDGKEVDSFFTNSGRRDGHYLALSLGPDVLVFYAQDQRFTAENRELYGVLATVRFLL